MPNAVAVVGGKKKKDETMEMIITVFYRKDQPEGSEPSAFVVGWVFSINELFENFTLISRWLQFLIHRPFSANAHLGNSLTFTVQPVPASRKNGKSTPILTLQLYNKKKKTWDPATYELTGSYSWFYTTSPMRFTVTGK